MALFRCAMCMRVGQHTAPLPRTVLKACIGSAPYADVVLGASCAFDEEEEQMMLCCEYCFNFGQNSAINKRHPLHMAVDFMLSGGCSMPAPTKPQLVRWIGGLDEENPILLHTRYGELHMRVQALQRIEIAFGVAGGFDIGMISLVRWLFEGSTRIFSDPMLGRNIRRVLSDWRGPHFWNALPSPCRRCRGGGAQCCYSSVLIAGSEGGLQSEIENVIEKAPVIPGITIFCLVCREVAAISFEYDDALKAMLDIKRPPFTRASYYAHLAMLHRLCIANNFFFPDMTLV